MEKLSQSRERLRQLVLYLMETAMRVKASGSSSAVFTVEGIANIAATIMDAVINIETALGTDQPSPAPPPPPVPPSPQSEYREQLDKLNQDIQRRAEEIRAAALADIRRQFEEMDKKADPPKPPEPPK